MRVPASEPSVPVWDMVSTEAWSAAWAWAAAVRVALIVRGARPLSAGVGW